jgi:hypothetical protein
VPVVGFLYAGSPEPNSKRVAAFRKDLSDTGYVEGRNEQGDWSLLDPVRARPRTYRVVD